MGKHKSLNYQIHEKMEELKSFGESKHEAKKTFKEGETGGIYSYNTYKSYKQTSIEFTKYLKENGIKYKNISDIEDSVCYRYLVERQEKGLSAWTISKDMAAMNKIFNKTLTKKEGGLKVRSVHDIKRSRETVKHDKEINLKNYDSAILIAKATGMRRQSVLKVEKKDFTYRGGLPVFVHLKEKGGRERNARILPEYREALGALLARSGAFGPLVDKYPHRIDNHAYRREYAQKMMVHLCSVYPKHSKNKNYKNDYNEKLVRLVSLNLGHNRPSVAYYHYLK